MEITKWVLDPLHSELGFNIKHLMISKVSGTLQKFNAEMEMEDKDFSTAQVRLSAEMLSISTNNAQRDEHLQNGDFFDVEKYPELNFQSTGVEKVNDDTFILNGDLTMKGQSRPVKLEANYNGIINDHSGQEKAGFSVSGKINRSDWGINFNGPMETGGFVLGEEVRIHSEVQLVKQVSA